MRFLPLLFATFATTILAGPDPPAGALVVGKGRQFAHIQSAVSAAKSGSTIFVLAGEYFEQVTIPADKSGLTIIGASSKPETHSGNTATITYKKSQKDGVDNDNTATVRVHASDVSLYNLNIRNVYGPGSQALALSAAGDKLGFYGCSFSSFQDTIETEGPGSVKLGRHLFANCAIAGATDFIFGKTAAAWFEDCDIKVVNTPMGWITAQGRQDENSKSGYVINNSTISGPSKTGTAYLGRPWRTYSRVMFQNSKMSDVVNSAGWAKWMRESGPDPTENLVYRECKNTGPGSATGKTRVSFAKVVDQCKRIESYLGKDYKEWVDKAYVDD